MGKTHYLGCRSVEYYEIGTDPRFFEKGFGFAFKHFVCDVPEYVVKKIFHLEMKPGDIIKIKAGSQKFIPLTEEEWRSIEKWKSRFSTRKTRPYSVPKSI